MASSCHIRVTNNDRNRHRMWDTKTTLHVRGINKSCKMITFSHLNFKEGQFNLQKWKTNSAQLND